MIPFIRSVLDAVAHAFGNRYIVEEGQPPTFPRLYTESHYALALILLYLLDGQDTARLDLAEARLRKWAGLRQPQTFFNGFAISLSRILVRSHGIGHVPLGQTLQRLCSEQRPAHKEAFADPCGNNMYLQQLMADLLLHPLAAGDAAREQDVAFLVAEFTRYKSPEGFYFDWPREGPGERLFPLAYCMKMLFLLGVCHQVHGDSRFRSLFVGGMRAALPIMTRDGGFCYFGRTDNSSFGIGLTIFNLKLAGALDKPNRTEYLALASRQQNVYRSIPQASGGYLEANRFAGGDNPVEHARSRDEYAYPTQYSVASSAYVLLSELYCPGQPVAAGIPTRAGFAVSEDLGLVRLASRDSEAIVRTGSQPQTRDRRYIGPTILRFECAGTLLIGAVPVTCSADYARSGSEWGRIVRIWGNVRHRYSKGVDELDARFTGFVPVLLRGGEAWVPLSVLRCSVSDRSVETEHVMVRLTLRGWKPALDQLLRYARLALAPLVRRSVPEAPADPVCLTPEPRIRLVRRIRLEGESLRIEDTFRGALAGTTVHFYVRHLPGAATEVPELADSGTAFGWSSDSKAMMHLYLGPCHGQEISYTCCVAIAGPQPRA